MWKIVAKNEKLFIFDITKWKIKRKNWNRVNLVNAFEWIDSVTLHLRAQNTWKHSIYLWIY